MSLTVLHKREKMKKFDVFEQKFHEEFLEAKIYTMVNGEECITEIRNQTKLRTPKNNHSIRDHKARILRHLEGIPAKEGEQKQKVTHRSNGCMLY